MKKQELQVVIYKAEDGQAKLEVRLQNDTVWFSNQQMADRFGRERSVITKHINNVFSDKELEQKSNVQILHVAGADRPTKFYNWM